MIPLSPQPQPGIVMRELTLRYLAIAFLLAPAIAAANEKANDLAPPRIGHDQAMTAADMCLKDKEPDNDAVADSAEFILYGMANGSPGPVRIWMVTFKSPTKPEAKTSAAIFENGSCNIHHD